VPSPRSRLLALAAFAAVLRGGCRVDATVEARVQGAGGTVTARVLLDREAVALLGGPIIDGAQTSDLHRAGWVTTGHQIDMTWDAPAPPPG